MDVARRLDFALLGRNSCAMRFDFVSLGPRRGALLALGLGIVLTLPFLRRDSSNQVSPESHQSATADGNQRTRIHPNNPTLITSAAPPQLIQSDPSAESLPAPTAQSPLGDVDRHSLIQSPPMVTEFPAWARKPSALDALMIRAKQAETETASTPIKHQLPPVAQAVEMSTLPPPVLPQPADTVDRYTPFSNDWGTGKEIGSTALATIEWPDQTLQTTTNQLANENSAGRPGELLDPTHQSNSPTLGELNSVLPPDSQANPGQIVAHRAIESTRYSATLERTPIMDSRNQTEIQPLSVTHPERPRQMIGAELRSRIPPSADLFIAQPSKN